MNLQGPIIYLDRYVIGSLFFRKIESIISENVALEYIYIRWMGENKWESGVVESTV